MLEFTGAISYEGAEPSDALVLFAKRCAYDARALKTASQLSRIVKAYDHPDGSQVYVLDYEHTWRVHIIPAVSIEEREYAPVDPEDVEGTAPELPIIDFVSGVTASGIIQYKKVDWLFPREMRDYGVNPESTFPMVDLPDAGVSPETAKRWSRTEVGAKIAVPAPLEFLPLGDGMFTPLAQMQVIRPGQFTGAMAPIVQLLLGVGFQFQPTTQERWRRERPDVNTPVHADVSSIEVDDERNLEIRRYDDVPEPSVRPWQAMQLTYDPRWSRTQGVMWGTSNTGKKVPMLVELGQRGISVMELPLDPASKLKKVQEQYEKVYPSLAKYTPFRGQTETLFQALGGFPTGENFPSTTADLNRWARSGRVVRLPDALNPFYSGTSGMCTYHGWAFHPSSPRAAIVGQRMQGLRRLGVCYEVVLNITEKPDTLKVRNPLAESVIAALSLSSETDIYKAHRITEGETEELLGIEDPQARRDRFDELEAASDWQVTYNITMLRSGFIDYSAYQCPRGNDPCRWIPSPHFKYYEPMIGFVVNFNFENEHMSDGDYADGPIFCSYTSSGIDILNYTSGSGRTRTKSEINTRQHCQFTGKWKIGWESWSDGPKGYFYSTKKDFREEVRYGGRYVTEYTGYRDGYADYLTFCDFFGSGGAAWRRYYGHEDYETEEYESEQYYASVMCAAYERSIYFVCCERSVREVGRSRGSTGTRHIGSSGTTAYGDLYHFVFHWTPGCRPNNYDWCFHEPTCRYAVCDVRVNHDPCFGSAAPADPGYQVCPRGGRPMFREPPFVSTMDGETKSGWHAYYSALYNINFSHAPTWSESDPTVWEFEYKVYGMGHDLMNGLEIREVKQKYYERHLVPMFESDISWWQCSVPNFCPTQPYLCAVNHFGKSAIAAQEDARGYKDVHIGAKLKTGFGSISIPFGVVE